MPRYDAFGREIGEDTLQGLGESSTESDWQTSWEERQAEEERREEPAPAEAPAWETAAAASAPAQATPPSDPVDAPFSAPTRAPDESTPWEAASAPAQAPDKSTPWEAASAPAPEAEAPAWQVPSEPAGPSEAPTPPSPTFVHAPSQITVRRSSGRGCLAAIVVAIALVLGVVVLIAGIASSIGGGTGSVTVSPPSQPAPKGLGGDSLVRAPNLAAALNALKTQGGRLTHVRIAPERVDAQLLTPVGRLRNVQIKPGGKLERFGPDSGPGFDGTNTIAYSRLRPQAPQRLARAGAERLGVPVDTLQYVVPLDAGGKILWAAYFPHSRYVIGDAAGRFQRAYQP